MSPIEAATSFLRMLGEGPHTFQTFDDSEAKAPSLSRVLHGTLRDRAIELTNLNARGAGVFVMVNQGDGKGRKASNVVGVRALFVDLDGAPIEPVRNAPLPAHCIVESSPGRWHAYWRVSNCPLERFRELQKALAVRFCGDPAVCDASRVMRLPGFDHRKEGRFRVQILALADRAPYSCDEVIAALRLEVLPSKSLAVRRRLPDVIPIGERNSTLLSCAAGFVRRGLDEKAVNARIQHMNAEKCELPLRAAEVDGIVARAVSYGSNGFIRLPHALFDSMKWKSLPPPTHDVILEAFRRFNGANNGSIALPWSDFDGRPGFRKKGTFYRHRRRAMDSGILIAKHGSNSQRGRQPDLVAIAEEWITPVSKKAPGASAGKVHPYIDKQACSDSGVLPHLDSVPETKRIQARTGTDG